ncbi:MAG TPA: acetyl-CoA hydrolase/transferase C-terminal domain-containing protein [Syntrophales bacterium]|nr:acetyl-CoA hydrolase/transferase C-terminal domain-containing protein [Syntrophales bacterium]
MSWKEVYTSRLMSAQEAAKIVKSGDRFWTPLLLGQPAMPIMDAIADRKDELKDVEYCFALVLRPYKIFKPEYRDTFKLVCGFYSTPHLQELAKSEWSNFWPAQSSDIAIKNAHRNRVFPRRTGIVLQVTPPDEHGFVSLGLDTFYTEHIMDQCEWIIAEVNSNMPRTYGQTNFHVSRFTAFVENPNPVIAVPTPDANEQERKMAENVVGLLRDRDCIQVGIGAVPAAISKLLEHSGLKDLGIHTEMAPAGTHRLVEKGVVSCKYKKINPGKIVLAFTMGDKELYEFLGNNPMVEFRPTIYANHIGIISQEENVVAINGSIEVDLTGQICSESVGNLMRTGSGGQLDFVVGSFWSKGGRAINLVPSTTLNDTVSRIVPYTTWGSRVTVPRHYAGFIVTEWGVADLYGRSEPERAEALIAIAHPKFREELEKAGRERGLIKKKTF